MEEKKRANVGTTLQLALMFLSLAVNLAVVWLAVADAARIRQPEQIPENTLLLSEYLEKNNWMPEGRYGQLAVVAAPYAVAFLLPLFLLTLGVVSLILRGRKKEPRWLPLTLIVLAALCLAVNAVCAHMIYHWTPVFGFE